MTIQISLAYGLQSMSVDVPEQRLVGILDSQDTPHVQDIPAAVRAALDNPCGSPPLCDIVSSNDKTVIIASDITRQWVRHDLFLPTLLNELNRAGVDDSQILLVVALGAHRRQTAEENVLTYGQEVVSRIKIVQSYASDSAEFVAVGCTGRGTEVFINRHIISADKVILTGGITYHSMAGFGGGRKAILPGVAGYATIQANHRLCLSRQEGRGLNPECRQGSLETNDMHLDMMEIAAMIKPAFLLNAVFNGQGDFAAFVAGNWQEAWLEGCRMAAGIASVPVEELADVVIASAGGYPKDINFYQASKTIENACLAVRQAGALIVAMECREIDDPPDFSQWFSYTTLYEREMALRKRFTVPGFVALKLGYIAKELTVIVVSRPENQQFLERAGMLFAPSLDAALAVASQKLGREDFSISILPQGGNVVPMRTI
ncbi:nickel-dependent lactate racemase [Sporomusa aerivorans]|uniref:nickel-dependent lactate racemase n=1 Tax=Sporomusa aerivorans TaxID=204936 RepID=UPI00352A230B